ncbi:MAG: sensor domain-containing diguanylate cyclase, partial [Pseudobutyrivibrio sp.]|nr:sensor domain-containing diguanylate cyclase [Pseudobutyrivibrio sp.]
LDRYLSSVSCGIMQYVKDTKELIYINDTALRILGYTSKEALLADGFDGVAKTVAIEDAAVLHELVDRLNSDDEVVDCEYRVIHDDGSERMCYGTIRMLYQADGTPIIQRSLIDITESKKSGNLYRETTDLLAGANMGLWYFIFDEGEPKFYVDSNAADLIGLLEPLRADKTYDFWYNNTCDDQKAMVMRSVLKMRSGVANEVIYTYNHPVKGIVTFRGGGILDKNYAGEGVMVRGYLQDVTAYNDRLMEQIEISESIQKHFDAVLSLNLTDGSIKILSDARGMFIDYATDAPTFESIFVPFTYILSKNCKEAYQELIDIGYLAEKLEGKQSVVAEIETTTSGWFRITVVPSNVLEDGTVARCLLMFKNIDAAKKKEIKNLKSLETALAKERRDYEILSSFAKIYDRAYLIDFVAKRYEVLGEADNFHTNIYEKNKEKFQEQIWRIMHKLVCEAHYEMMEKFSDYSTLSERMADKNSISVEAVSSNNRWLRFTFIRVSGQGESFDKVIIAAQDIDDIKKKEDNLIIMSNTDELTGLYNRHAYEEAVAHIQTEGIGDDLWYIEIDVNGLKQTNDTLGHAAGDELIIATANCMRLAFSSIGRIYRMGGDEFFIVFRGTKKDADKAIRKMEDLRDNWSGQYSKTLSFSKGVVCSCEIDDCTFLKLEKESDARMYVEKRDYHINNDRRKPR